MRNECETCGGSLECIGGQVYRCTYCGKLYSADGGAARTEHLEQLYNDAILSGSGDEKSRQNALKTLEVLGNYKDSHAKATEIKEQLEKDKIEEERRRIEEERQRIEDERREHLESIRRKKEEFRTRQRNRILALVLGGVLVIVLIVVIVSSAISRSRRTKYEEATTLYNQAKYEESLELFSSLGDYEDSEKKVTELKQLINDRNNAYARGKNYYDNKQYGNAITEFKKCVYYSDSKDYIEKSGAAILELAQQQYDLGNYYEAKKLLAEIPNDISAYNSSVALIESADKAIEEEEKSRKYAEALAFYEEEELESAQDLFILVKDYSDSNTYLHEIGNRFYDHAQSAYNEGDLDLCGTLLNRIDEENEWDEYLTALEFKNGVKEEYINSFRQEAKQMCRTEGADVMTSFIDSKKNSLLSDEDIVSLKNECTIKIVSLKDISPYYKNDILEDRTNTRDIMNNEYSYAIVGCAPDNDDDTQYNWTYNIGGKYTSLAADVFVTGEGIDDYMSGSIRIYGDNKLIYKAYDIDLHTKSFPIEVDVTGVNDLSIVIYANVRSFNWPPRGCGLGNPRVVE